MSAPSTAAPPTRSRAWIGWVALVLLVVGGALLALRIADATSVPLRAGQDPESAGSSGTRALAEILRDRGVEVEITRSRGDVAGLLTEDSTLVMTDPYPLSDEAVTRLLEPADRVVLLSSSARMLRLLDLGDDDAGATVDRVTASCDVAEFARVGGIRPDRMFTPADDVTGCFTDAGGRAAVLVAERGDQRVSLVAGRALFGNEHLAEDGNAALALALLAQTDRIVWYVPSFDDSDITANDDPTLGELTPPWVTPAIVLLLLAGVVAALWRGRRFGPLVAETLPVTVRASETMQGRARLTAKTADAAHAAGALRDGSARRMARRLGLSERATASEVADAAADRLHMPRAHVQETLAGDPPENDEQLIGMARRLAEIEAAIDAGIRDERRTP